VETQKTERIFIATRRARYWQHTSAWKAVGFKTMGLRNTIKWEKLQNCEKKTLKSEINLANKSN